MKILITGICGFVGSSIACWLREHYPEYEIKGIDNLIRRGSQLNLDKLRNMGVQVEVGDIRHQPDIDRLGSVDWVIDAAALPSVLGGIAGHDTSHQVVDHNLIGTLRILEYCRANHAGLILLSTSRVYSIAACAALPLSESPSRFELNLSGRQSAEVSDAGLAENFSTTAPISIYGGTKLASEIMALEYSSAFNFPLWINRCGVIGGAGQFGRADQGIIAYWINSHLRRQPLRFIGFGGTGKQVRDCLHPHDLARLVVMQINREPNEAVPRIINVSGGAASAFSLLELHQWCDDRFGAHSVQSATALRPYDIPWIVLDFSSALRHWSWQPQIDRETIFAEVAQHARAHPEWLELTQ
jgi:CDP-paratose 2-epimerase